MTEIVATKDTQRLARAMIRGYAHDGAEAVLALLPNIRPEQAAALLCVVVREAAGVPARGSRNSQPDRYTVAEQRHAHAAFYRGHRDAWTVEGEREYQRARKRARREAS